MYFEMARRAKASSHNSIDWRLQSRGIYKKTQTKIDELVYASGNKVIKAFIAIDWNFYYTKGHGLAETPKKLRITFRIQKNRNNDQQVTVTADNKQPSHICFLRIVPEDNTC